MKLKIIASVISTLYCSSVYAASSDNKTANFDTNILKSRGLSPDVAKFFASEKRYAEGVNYVTILVNGVKLGTTDVQFDAKGELCVTPALLSFAQISLPDTATKNTEDAASAVNTSAALTSASGCINLLQHYPQAIIRLRPNADQIELLVPPEAVRNAITNDAAVGVSTGGTAALLNYDVLDARNYSPGNNSHTLQAQTEVGLNTHDWILRSRQSYNHSNGVQQFSNINAYAQKTLVEQKAILQVGQINPNSGLFSVPTLLGAQIIPEAALMKFVSGGVSASGIAQSEARVEVRQKGTLIYSTLVPPGPFTLTRLPIIDSNADLAVKIIENGGVERTFIVSSGSFNLGFNQTEKSISFAMGRVDQAVAGTTDNDSNKHVWLATVDANLPLSERANLETGVVLSTDYHGAGFGISAAPTRNTSVNLRNVWSHQQSSGWVGTQVQLNGTAQLSRSLSLNASLQQQTKKFRNVGDPTTRSTPAVNIDGSVGDNTNNIVFASYKQQQTSSLSYQLDKLGSLGLSYSKFTGFNNNQSERLGGSWSKSFGRVNLTVSFEHSTGANKDNTLYASLNIPLGARSINASSSRHGDRIQSNIGISERINDYLGYSASASTDNESKRIGTSVGVNFLPKYAQLNFNTNYQGAGSSSFNSSMSGGIVAHKAGVTFSPYHVQDTFALISVPGISGARVNTPQGPVWTDFTGHAVAPNLPAYSDGQLELVTKSLPRTADVKTGIRTVRLGRGAVTNTNFNIIQVRRALLRVLNKTGNPVEKGTAIFDGNGTWITSIGTDGSIFLDDKQLRDALKATNQVGNSCSFTYQFPDKIDPDTLYETGDVTCS